jgi:hypothetical protein
MEFANYARRMAEDTTRLAHGFSLLALIALEVSKRFPLRLCLRLSDAVIYVIPLES